MNQYLARRECYEILGVPYGASQDTVREAYLKKARDSHPDKNGDDPESTREFQRVSKAYCTLQESEPEYPSTSRYTHYDSDSDSDSEYAHRRFFFRDHELNFFMYFFQKLMEESLYRQMHRPSTYYNRHRYYHHDDDDDDDDFFFSGYAPRNQQTWSSGWGVPGRNTDSRQTGSAKFSSTEDKQTRSSGGGMPGRNADSRQTGSSKFSYTEDKTRHSGTRWTFPKQTGSGRPRSPQPRPKVEKVPPPPCKKPAPAYVVKKPATPSKKKQLAEQSRRQREADVIGRELRAKAKKNAQLEENKATPKNAI